MSKIHGPRDAKFMFVGAVSSDIDKARREPVTGPAGYVFKGLYLKPLRVKRSEVLIANTDGDPQGIIDFIEKMEIRPYVIALSHQAKRELGESLIDIVLPHPDVVRRLGDSGEVARKIRKIRKHIKKQEAMGAEGGDDLEQSAENFWANNWFRLLSSPGSGRFVYQQHFMGLDEDEAELGAGDLMGTDNALHGDFRLEGDDNAFGWTVFLGSTADNNRLKAKDKLIDGQQIPMAAKHAHGKEWIDAGGDNGLLIEPGDPGAPGDKFGRMFMRDLGDYRVGVAFLDNVEIFLDGRELNGRYLINSGPDGSQWLITRPEDQTPIAAREKLEDVTRDLKGRGERFLIWPDDNGAPQLIDVRSGLVVKSKEVSILKADDDKKIVYGVVLDPYQETGGDAHGDYISPREIERTAHEWMKKSRMISLNHEKSAGGSSVVESWIEQYPSRKDYINAQDGKPHRAFRRKYGDDFIHSGAWVLGTQLSDDLWEEFKKGAIQAYSIEGFGVRNPIKRDDIPDVKFVDLVELKTDVE